MSKGESAVLGCVWLVVCQGASRSPSTRILTDIVHQGLRGLVVFCCDLRKPLKGGPLFFSGGKSPAHQERVT